MDYEICADTIIYQELDPRCPEEFHLPKIKDCIDKENIAYEGKEKIIRYLETQGTPTIGCGIDPKDIFSGEIISKYKSMMTDGTYSWSSVIPYYMRKYNLRMPKSFEDYILSMDF